MTGRPEDGSSPPEGTPIEDRLVAALSNVSSRIEVGPRAFEPPAPCRHRGRSADPVRMPLRWVAAAVLVVGLGGVMTLSSGAIDDDVVVTGTSEDELSPVGYDAPTDGTIDEVFLDYVAPVDGDRRRSAERLFIDGYTWARSKSVTECLEGSGRSNSESFWALAMSDWYVAHASPAESKLPALKAIAEGGMERPRQDVVSVQVSESVQRCSDSDESKASSWQRDVERLQEVFAGSVGQAIAEVEAGPMWAETRDCLVRAGAPANDARGVPHARIEAYVDRLSDEPTASRGDDGGGSQESKDFAACTARFYSEVEEKLAAPRATFVADHRDELLALQTEFAAFA